jgi:predicted nucleic acid-binding protein
MTRPVLLDSSAWIEASRLNGNEQVRSKVAALLAAGATAMTEPVWAELYQGARGRREEEQLEGWRSVSVWLPFDARCWEQAAVIGRKCLRSGTNIPFGDVLVFACAKRHGVELLERDRHFAMIEAACGEG